MRGATRCLRLSGSSHSRVRQAPGTGLRQGTRDTAPGRHAAQALSGTVWVAKLRLEVYNFCFYKPLLKYTISASTSHSLGTPLSCQATKNASGKDE